MKKLLLASMLAVASSAYAQIGPPASTNPNATPQGYGFTQTTGTYTALSASRTIWQSGATLATDAASSAISLPFTFQYNGRSYTTLFISNNGFVTFGNAPLAATYTGLSTDSSATNLAEGAIAGFAANLVNANTTTSEIAYETVGSKFVVQFTDLKQTSGSSAQLLTFQIQLDSSNNTVSIVYGTCASGTATTTGQVGIRGSEASDINNRTGTNWTTTTSGTSATSSCTIGTTNSTTVPASGLTFTYTPGTWISTPAYATLPYTNDFSTWINGNSTADLPGSNWKTWPSRGDNSWRQSDISVSGFTSVSGWTSLYGTSTIASPGVAPTARFHSYNCVNASGYMDLYLDLSTGGSGDRVISFDYQNASGSDILEVLLSTDGGSTFNSLGTSLGVQASWATKTFITSSTSSTAVVRLLATGDNGSTDIYLDNLQVMVSNVVPACTAISAPANAATGVSVTPTISWSQSALATSYLINIGTIAGGTDVLNGLNVGNVSSYTIGTSSTPSSNPLNFLTQYYITVIPINAVGNAVGCPETLFTTANISCPSVSAPSSAATGVSLTPTITWSASNGATGYKISMGTTSGGTDILNNVDVGNVLTYTLPTALNNSTVYYYTVNAYNANTISSSCSVRNFTTVCAAIVPAYTNNFSVFPGSCWSRASGGNPSSGVGTGTSNYWTEDGFLNVGTTGAARFNLYSTGRNGWLLSPAFDLSAGGYRVKFDYGLTSYNATSSNVMGSDDVVQFVVSTNGGTTWSVLQTWDVNNSPSNTLNTYVFDLTGYTGNNVKFAMFGSDGTVDDTPDYDFFVDNFIVESIPACDIPLTVAANSVTHNSVTLSWGAPSVAPSNGYEYYYSTSNVAPTSGTSTTSLSIPLASLTAQTTYYYWVRSVCSGSQSAWVSGSFTTLYAPPVNDLCSNAIALVPGNVFTTNPYVGTTLGATLTTDATATTSCQGTRYADTWYTVVVPASGTISIETKSQTGSAVTDTVLGVYTGTCGGFTQVGCDDDNGDGNFSLLNLSATNGISAGQTLYIGVWNYSSSNNGEFQISAYDSSILATSETSIVKNNVIKAYPNPFTDLLTISDVKNVKSITISDMSGKIVKTIQKPESTLRLGDLNAGMYLVILNMNDGSRQTIKAIKK